MGLGLTHLQIDDNTTIQDSILEGQEGAPNGKNIIGTINKIIDTAGTGGMMQDYSGDDLTIGITQERKIYTMLGWDESQVRKGCRVATQYINRHADPGQRADCIQLAFDSAVWSGYADFGCAVDLMNPTYPCYRCLNQDGNLTKVEWWTIRGEPWYPEGSEWQWARGTLTWVSSEPFSFYEKLYLNVEDLREMKTVYNIKENSKIDLSGIKMRFDHKEDNSAADRGSFICDMNNLPYWLHYDSSQIDMTKPGIYPLYIWPMFSPNKTIVNIEIKE